MVSVMTCLPCAHRGMCVCVHVCVCVDVCMCMCMCVCMCACNRFSFCLFCE